MRRTIILIFSVFVTCLAYAQSNIDVQHYRYHIELNDDNDTIYGRAEILVRFTAPTNTIQFDLTGRDSKGKGMKVTLTEGRNTRGTMAEGEKLKLVLSKEAAVGDTATYTIRYHGIPTDGLIISKNKYNHRTFFADNWPNRGHHWLPCVDDPADKASVEFIVTAPGHYQVVSNGVQVEETNLPGNKKRTHWKEDVPISTKVTVIGVADFAVNLSGIINGCIPVYSWVYPEDRDKGFFDYAQAAEILPYFINKVGPYAYKKLANVESKTIFGGLENANTIFYSESSITGTRKYESLLAHEIAHQWFGNMATEKTFAHLWLSEGFATYMTILYMENKYGWDTARAMLIEDREQVIAFAGRSNRPVVDNNPDYMELLNANSYQKGGWVLHMLRRQLGDSIFWRSIRSYYATYAGKTADTGDLQKIFEKVSGKDLGQFFNQWLHTAGIPQIDMSWKYNSTTKKIVIDIKQTRGKFDFPLELGIKYRSGEIIYNTIQVSQSQANFEIVVKEQPLEVIADPKVSLLYNGNIKSQ